jgi:Heterokaryon incompatibility protein (HET)
LHKWTIRQDRDTPLNDLPRTIEDAVDATRRLGKQYLWVDRYCINQLDLVEKSTQIHSMSTIFEKAWVTIVSLSSSAEDGLPGVSRTRHGAPVVMTDQCCIFPFNYKFLTEIEDSAWKTRGWTLQEGCLSPRLLFFADDQVILTSTKGTTPEIFACLHENDEEVMPRLNYDTIGLTFSQSTEFVSLSGVFHALSEYFNRELTFEDDSLAAFRGFLTRCGVRSYHGVPVLECQGSLINSLALDPDEVGFIFGLLWYQPDASVAPRRMFRHPSWSWASRRRRAHPTVRGSNSFGNRYSGRTVRFAAGLSFQDPTFLPLRPAGPVIRSQPEAMPLVEDRGPSIWIRSRVVKLTIVKESAPGTKDEGYHVKLGWAPHRLATRTRFYPDSPLPDDGAASRNSAFPTLCAILLLVSVENENVHLNDRQTFWLAFRIEMNGHIPVAQRVGLVSCTFARVWDVISPTQIHMNIENGWGEGEHEWIELR